MVKVSDLYHLPFSSSNVTKTGHFGGGRAKICRFDMARGSESSENGHTSPKAIDERVMNWKFYIARRPLNTVTILPKLF